MRLVPSLVVVAGYLIASSAAAQQKQDTTFKNVEYVSGSAALKEKQKGTLVVSTTDVKLVDKKGNAYLTIPVATIRSVKDSSFAKPEKKGGASVSGVPSLGFLKKKPDGQVIVTTEKDSATETIVFQTTERGTISTITAVIQSRLPGGAPVDAAAATPASDTSGGADAKAGASANEPPPLMIIANPYTAVEADSAAAVEIGSVVRDDISAFLGDKVQVLTRKQMNTAIEPYGYPTDAILSQSLAVTLAQELHASVLITGELKKESDGKYTVTASLGSPDKPNGTPATVTQNAGESLTDFGHRVADALKGPQQPTP